MTDAKTLLSRFIDEWNGGRQPDIDEFLDQAKSEAEEAQLAREIETFLEFAPTPKYSDDQMAALRASSAIAASAAAFRDSLGASEQSMVAARLERGLTVAALARKLLRAVGLKAAPEGEAKTERYLRELEAGAINPGRLTEVVRKTLESILGVSPAGPNAPELAASYRADEVSAEAAANLGMLIDALEISVPDGERDEIDALFFGDRPEAGDGEGAEGEQ